MTTIPLIGYLVAVLAIAAYSARRATPYDYLLSSRSLGFLALGASIAAGFFDSFVLVTFTAYVYFYGWPALTLFVGTAAGLLLFSVFAPQLRKEAGNHSYYGMSDYFEQRYGHGSAVVVSLINVVFYVALLLIQIIFGSTLLMEITGFSYGICILLIAATLLAYVGTGGFRAVIVTDIFQWGLIGILLIVVAGFLLSAEFGPSMSYADWSGSAGDAVGFLLIGCMASFAAPELWQRCFAARDKYSARRGVLLAAALFPVSGLILVVIGFTAATMFPGIDPQSALVHVFRESLSGGLSGVGLVLLLAAIMSTADTCLFVIAPTLVLNVLRTKRGSERKAPTFSIMSAALVLACMGAFLTQDLLKIALALASLSLGIFPVLFIGLLAKLSSRVVNVAMVSGFVVVALVLAAGSLDPATSAISLPVSLVIVLGWLGYRKLLRRGGDSEERRSIAKSENESA